MVDENCSSLTTTTLGQPFYDFNHAENHTREKKKERKRVEEKKTLEIRTHLFIKCGFQSLERTKHYSACRVSFGYNKQINK